MSSIAATNAVVLRSIKFQESSRIVTFYTERFGRIAGIVKGARKSPGRFGASLRPMSQVCVVVYRKPGREVQTVSQCDLTVAYRRIPIDLERMSVGLQMVELVTMITHDEEENRPLYDLLSRSLSELDGEIDPGCILLYYFEIRLAGIFGFRPDFAACAGCGRPYGDGLPEGTMVRIDIERGGPLCGDCDSPGRRCVLLSASELQLLGDLSVRPRAGSRNIADGSGGRSERIEKFLFDFYTFHLPGFRRLRSGEVFRQVGEHFPPKTS